MPTAFGFRPHSFHNNLPSGLPICVTAVFNPSGEFKPVAFSAEIRSMLYRFKIHKIIVTKENHGNVIFDCEYIDTNTVKTVRLVFDVTGCRWIIG